MATEQSGGLTVKRVFDQIFSQYMLLILAGVLGIVSIVAILRAVYREQGFQEVLVQCEGEYDLRIIAPWTIPSATDDINGKPITIQLVKNNSFDVPNPKNATNIIPSEPSPVHVALMIPVSATTFSDLSTESLETEFQVSLVVESPYYLLDEQGQVLTRADKEVPLAPEFLRVFLKAEPLDLPLVNRNHRMMFVSTSLECRLPPSPINSSHTIIIEDAKASYSIKRVGERQEISIGILREGVIQNAIFQGFDFLSTAEAWAALLISLGGGVLTLKLREWDAKKKLFESDVDALLDSDDLLGALQRLKEIEEEPRYPEYEEVLLRSRKKVFTRNNMSRLMKIASHNYLIGEIDRAKDCLRNSLDSMHFWEKSKVDAGLMLDELMLVAKVILRRSKNLDKRLASIAVFALYDKSKFDYYGLIVEGLKILYGESEAEGLSIKEWNANQRTILIDPRLRDALKRNNGPMFIPTVNPRELYLPPSLLSCLPYQMVELDIDRHENTFANDETKYIDKWQNSPLLAVSHKLDMLFLQRVYWRSSKSWPIALPLHPEGQELFTDKTLISMCQALSTTWLQLARGMPILDLLVGERKPLLGSLLLWAAGGTKSALLSRLMQTKSIVRFGDKKKESKLVEIDENTACELVDRFQKAVSSEHNGDLLNPNRNLLRQWLTLTPTLFGFDKNLFVLMDIQDPHLSMDDKSCWIDEDLFNQEDYNCPLFKFVTMRPMHFVPSARFIEVLWDTDDIEEALHLLRRERDYFMKSALSTLAAAEWKRKCKASVERIIAEQAAGSLGKAIEMADRLDALHREKGGGKVLSLEDILSVIKVEDVG